MSAQPMPRRSTEELLASVRDQDATIAEAEVQRMRDLREWALANTVDPDSGEKATIYSGRDDTGLPIAGPGAPLVSEFALMELCALLGRSTASGRDWVGKVMEITFRLSGIWEHVKAGRVAPWRAMCIAEKTRHLPADAAQFVDRQLKGFAATCTWAQVDRFVEEALVRFDPTAAEKRRREAAEKRRFDVETGQVSFDGTVRVEGELDLADGLDLDAAVGRRAKQLGALGCEESLDVRRSMAAGEIARQDLALDFDTTEQESGSGGLDTGWSETPPHEPGSTSNAGDEPDLGGRAGLARDERVRVATTPPTTDASPFRKTPGRKVELFVHLTDLTLNADPAGGVARCGNTRTPISPEQVKQWCSAEGTTVIVRPVIDLAGHEPIDNYEIPERLRRQTELRDKRCRFPHCTRPAESCDLDHAIAHGDGGVTCPCNLAPLCRGHHRAKTFTRWRYVVLDPGTYLWTSPIGYQYLVDHRGTRGLDTDSFVPHESGSTTKGNGRLDHQGRDGDPPER